MTQLGEGVAVIIDSPEQEEPEKEREGKKVRISVFFDGTLNNRLNIDAREKNEEAYIKHGKPQSSYENGRTNIAIMEPHVKPKSEGYDLCLKAYVEGQGTYNLKSDSFLGYALAVGDSGVPKRADKGLTMVVNALLFTDEINRRKHKIDKLSIDVFGFSRGAATARLAIYKILKDKARPLCSRLQDVGFTIEESAVEVSFAGLYDTVLSYLASQKFKSSNNRLEQSAVKYAKSALHLAAAEEHRKDFPLHNIKSCGGKGKEFFLPGVHSDIGGSYNKASEEALRKESDPNKKVYMLPASEDQIINTSTDRRTIEADMQALVQQGWYKATAPNASIGNEPEIEIIERRLLRHKRRITRYNLRARRDNICTAYCNIPLKIMAKFAHKEGIKISSKLKRRADITLRPYSDLLALEKEIDSYVSSSNSKPEDWQGNTSPQGNNLQHLRNRHLNFSSKIKTGYNPRMVKGKRTRFIYDA